MFKSKYFVWIILFIVSFGGLIISAFKLPNFIYYVVDLINISLFIVLFTKHLKQGVRYKNRTLGLLLVCFICASLIGIVGNGVPLILSIWGVRNIFRYVVFLYLTYYLLEIEDIEKFVSKIDLIYWINFIIVLVQKFVFNYHGDYLGGIFGIEQGCNGSLIIFLNIALSFKVNSYLLKRDSLINFATFSLAYFLISALSELKGNFVFFFVIIAIAMLISNKTLRVLRLLVSSVILGFAGFMFLNIIFPNAIETLLDFNKASNYLDASFLGYTSFTRNHLFSITNVYFFKDNFWLYLFGYGIGACDMSSFFESPFYHEFGYMNYRQYGISMTLLQTGYVGLSIYLIFLISIFVYCWKLNKKENINKVVCQSAACVSLFAILDSFYATLYVDMGYWVFFVLIMPFILNKNNARTVLINVNEIDSVPL